MEEKEINEQRSYPRTVRNESRLSDCSVTVVKSWDYLVWGSVFGGVYILSKRISDTKRRPRDAARVGEVEAGLLVGT